jgi:hypothetical protein
MIVLPKSFENDLSLSFANNQSIAQGKSVNSRGFHLNIPETKSKGFN